MAARLLVVATSTDGPEPPSLDTEPGTEVGSVTIVRVSPLVVVPRFAAVKQAVSRLASYRTIALTSAHAVDALVAALRSLGHDVRTLFGIQLAVVGSATAARLDRYGLRADLVADGGGEKLAQEIVAAGLGEPILYPRAADGHPALLDALRAAGRQVDELAAYDTRPDTVALKQALLSHGEDPFGAFAFASPKGVRAIVDVFGSARLAGAYIGAIGATTRDALVACGFSDVVVAERPSIERVIELLVERLRA